MCACIYLFKIFVPLFIYIVYGPYSVYHKKRGGPQNQETKEGKEKREKRGIRIYNVNMWCVCVRTEDRGFIWYKSLDRFSTPIKSQSTHLRN